MSALYEFFSTNLSVVYFIYGLVFFLMGFAIFLQKRRMSKIPLAKHLWLLAWFGIIHGLSEWGFVFIPIQDEKLYESSIILLRFIIALSFFFLLQFGMNLVIKDSLKWLKLLPALLFTAWFGVFVFYVLSSHNSNNEHLLFCETLARYFLALPGAILTGFGLIKHKEQIQFINRHLVNNLLGAALAFYIYSIVGGFFVPGYNFFPANKFNSEFFFQVTGIPIAVLRTACGLVGAYFIIRVLEIFDQEYSIRLEEAEKIQAVLLDRERIARDLHDGIIQSIYAVGLNLENTRYLLQENPVQAEQEITSIMEKLNNIIVDLRQCILNLRPVKLTDSEFQKSIISLITEFKRNTGISTDFSVIRQTDARLPQGSLSHIYFIVNEALNNIAKHANANQVKVQFIFRPEYLELSISDNGKGFSSPDKFKYGSQGLRNIRERAAILQGWVRIESSEGQGTVLELRIPYEGKCNDENLVG